MSTWEEREREREREREKRRTHWRMLECYLVTFAEGKHAKAAVTSLAFRYTKSRIKRLEIRVFEYAKHGAIAIQRADTANWRTHPFFICDITSQQSLLSEGCYRLAAVPHTLSPGE